MKVELTQEQVQNLLVIVSRTQISGEAAETIVELKNVLNNALSQEVAQPAKEEKK